VSVRVRVFVRRAGEGRGIDTFMFPVAHARWLVAKGVRARPRYCLGSYGSADEGANPSADPEADKSADTRAHVHRRYFGVVTGGCQEPACVTCEALLPEETRFGCAGAYGFGAPGSNECPASYFRILAEVACRSAAAAAGLSYGGIETEEAYPRGCYSGSVEGGIWRVKLNMATAGAGQSQSRLLCSGARVLFMPALGLMWAHMGTRWSHSSVSWGYSKEPSVRLIRTHAPRFRC
jgi:hypothetical protein